MWPEQLRRKLLKHPDYAKAHAAGLLHAKGLLGMPVLDGVLYAQAMHEVFLGETVTVVATRHGLALSTLTKKVHKAYPGIVLPKGEAGGFGNAASKLDSAREAVERCHKALDKAEKALKALAEQPDNIYNDKAL